MQINEIKRNTSRKMSVQVGRGGKRGKTSGRGGKGQTARAGNKRRPVLRDQIKKLPKRRGYGKNRALTVNNERVDHVAVSLAVINKAFKAGEKVTLPAVIEKGIVDRKSGKMPQIKVVNVGGVDKALVFERVSVTVAAKAAIEKAGGSIL